jgi:hypothetical protein
VENIHVQPELPLLTCSSQLLTTGSNLWHTRSKLKLKFKLRPTVNWPVYLGVGFPSGTHDQILFCIDNCMFLDVWWPLWWEDGSVIYLYNCFWALPEQSLSMFVNTGMTFQVVMLAKWEMLTHSSACMLCRADHPLPRSLANTAQKVTFCHHPMAASLRHSDISLIGR